MDESQDVVERLMHQLGRAAALRAAAAEHPGLEAVRQDLRAWQAARLARTHADLVASPRMGLAAKFFLNDIYGAQDLAGLDADIRRIAPAMKRLLPAAGVETVVDAIELEALSEDLDLAMATALGAGPDKLTAAAYRKVDRRPDRERQIDLVEELGRSLDHLVDRRLIGAALSMMRRPAKLAGLGELQDFLQRGYNAFVKMRGASEFLGLIVGRERRLLDALFAGDDSLLDAPAATVA